MKHYVPEEQIDNFTSNGVNLWSMPRLYSVEYIEKYEEGKKVYKTQVVPNPILKQREKNI